MSKKLMKKACALTLACSMAFSTVVVSNAASKKKTKANTVKISTTSQAVPGTVVVKAGKSVKLTTTATKCKVKSSNKKVVTAKVSKKSITVKVAKKAKKGAKATLTITKKGYKTKKVTIKVGTPATLKLEKTSVKVTEKKTATVKVKSFKGTTKKDKLKVATSNKKVATAKVTSKKVTIKGLKKGTATITVYDAYASVKKTIKVTVKAKATTTPAVVTETKNIPAVNGVFTLPCAYDKVTKLVVKKGTKSYTLEGDLVKNAIAEYKNKTASKTFAAKKAGDELATVNGVKATVKTANADGSKVVSFAGKDYTVKVTDTDVTINATKFTPDATKNTLTVSNAAKTNGVEIEVTYTK